jgi:hypothetical protein
VRYQQENCSRRRLFEHFQKGVGCLRLQIIGGIDDDRSTV